MNTTPSTQVKKEVQSITFFIFSLLDSFFFCTTHCLALYQIINSVLNPLFYFIIFFLWMKEQKKNLSFILFYNSLWCLVIFSFFPSYMYVYKLAQLFYIFIFVRWNRKNSRLRSFHFCVSNFKHQ